MLSVPLPLAEWLFGLPFLRRPQLLGAAVMECPDDDQLSAALIMVEIRDGHRKWVHLCAATIKSAA
jgi:hypothetical protein